MPIIPFPSLDACLHWAYESRGVEVIQRPSLFSWRGKSGRTKPTGVLSPHELAGQAAQIRHKVEVLGSPLHEFAEAYYGAGHQKITHLTKNLEGDQHVLELIILQYKHSGVDAGGIDAIRRRMRCRTKTALDHRREVFDRLDHMRSRLIDALTPDLVAGGLLAS